MSGVAPCAPPGVTGTLTTTALLCDTLNVASKVDLRLPEVAKPTSVTDDMMPAALKSAMTACTGTSSCKFIGYDFDSDLATPASASRYVVDTYSSTVENSGVLVSKGKKTSGTVSGVVPDTTTGGSTGTVTYTADNGQTYTFQGKWRSVQTSGVSVDVYFDPANMARGGLIPGDLGFKPPVLVEPPGYELPDFQAASIAGSNLISTPPAASVEECAKKCDETDTCTGFNFGGLDTLATCELVKDTTTNRAYADGKSGFRKETISRTQTGDGSNPSGTDFTNEGIYCRDALACNTDIARIITENVGSTNPIAALSTTDIDSCAYCPIRTYATTGNVTTNEIGVSKSNPTPAAAITELQYSSDETFATHLTITAGKWYKMSAWKEQTGGGRIEFYMSPVATSTTGVFNMLCFSGVVFFMSKQFTKGSLLSETFVDFSREFTGMNTTNMSYNFDTVDYVTNGFTLSIDFIGPMTLKWEGAGWWHIIPLHNGRLTNEYNNAIFVLSEVSGAVILSAISAGTRGFYDPAVGAPGQVKTYNNPGVFINSNNDKFKLTDDGTQVILRKFTDETLFGWYKDLNPSWDGPFINSWKMVPWIDTDSGNPVNDPVNKFDSSSTFWTIFPTGLDMPDPYAALGQFRTLDVAPPSTAQAWAYDRRQGCDKNCGSITDGYAIYHCTASRGGNCDPGKGASVSGSVCSGTHISCQPGDDSTDLKAQFSFKFRGLLPVSTKVKSGGHADDHDTDALRVRTIYSLDSAFSISVTPDESIRNLYTIFPPFVIDRIRRTPGLGASTICAKTDGYTWVNPTVNCTTTTCPSTARYYYNDACYTACPSTVPYWPFVTYNNGLDETRVCKASCPSTLPLIEQGNMCVAECGYLYRDGNMCLASCPSTKPYVTPITGSSNYNCVASCPADKPYNIPNFRNLCAASCAEGAGTLYLSGTTCVTACPTTAEYKQNGTCVSACSGTTPYVDGYTDTCVASCPSQKPYVDGNRCVATCPLTDPVTSSCVSSCPAARPFTIRSLSGNYCAVSCGASYYRESPTSYNCGSACPIGSPPVNMVCTQCTPGNYSLTITMACTQCLAGYYCPGAGTIRACVSGKYCPAGSTSENACPAGSYCSTPSTKTTCSAGYSCPAGSISQTACGFTPAYGNKWAKPGTDCTTMACTTGGSYCSGGVETVCSGACSAGTYETTACTTSTNRGCSGCGSGYYCTGGTARASCTTCLAGTYETKACTASTNTNCATCDAGYYCTGGSAKTACDLGNYCPAGSSSQTACTGSNTGGFYCPTTSTKYDCTACQSGYYASSPCNSIANTACSLCMQGQNDGSVSCPGGFKSNCPMDCKLSALQDAAKYYYYNTYHKRAYQITSINTIENRNEQDCRYYYSWRKVSDGSTGTDVKLWRFSNPYSYCTSSKLPVVGIYANQ